MLHWKILEKVGEGKGVGGGNGGFRGRKGTEWMREVGKSLGNGEGCEIREGVGGTTRGFLRGNCEGGQKKGL
jgi:hypothetical protein